jgi:PAS domain S-box-containing protein
MESPDKPYLPELLTEEQMLAFALSGSNISRWKYDAQSNSYEADDNFYTLFNSHVDSTLDPETIHILIAPADRRHFREELQEALSAGTHGKMNIVVRTASMPQKLVHLIGQAYTDAAGQVSGIIGSAVEIPQYVNERQSGHIPENSDLTAGPEENYPSEERFRSLITHAPVATCLFVGENMVIEIANEIMIEYWGKDRSVIGKPLMEAVPELEGQPFTTILKDMYRTGIAHEAKNAPARLKVDGVLSTFYFDFTYKPLFDREGNVYGIINMAIDVTSHAIYLKELQASQERFRSIIASAPAAMGIFTGRDMVVELPNQAFIDGVGRGQDIVGKRLADLLPELESQSFLQILDEVFTTGKPYAGYGVPVDIHRDGKVLRTYYNMSFTPLRDGLGNIYGVLDISVDVTENVLAKQKVELAEGNLRNVIELAEVGTWRADLSTQMVECSPRLLKWYGLESSGQIPLDEMQGMIDPGDLVKVSAVLRDAATPENSPFYNCEYNITARDGTQRALRDRGQVHFDAEGRPVSISGSVQDITNQIRDKVFLEKQINLRTAELTESLADLERSNANLKQFAYIASHDLQEPLRKIQTFSDLLIKRYTGELGGGIDYLNRIHSAAKRMSVLIRDLLDFSGISTRQQVSSTVRLDQVIEAVLVDLEVSVADSGAQIKVGQLPAVKGDRTQLGQLFSNLISNAIKFSSPGIAPVVEIDCITLTKAQLPPQVNPTRDASRYYRIDIMDNGIGFDPKYNDRIFQVFQRLHSKSEFSGTGIGLAICEKVAANHGGAIKAASALGHGSVFSVYLPV